MTGQELAAEIYRRNGKVVLFSNTRHALGTVVRETYDDGVDSGTEQPLIVIREATQEERDKQTDTIAEIVGFHEDAPIKREYAYIVETD